MTRNPLHKIPDDLIIELANAYGTPYYLVDERTLLDRIMEIKRAYSRYRGGVDLAYSIKANFTPKILRIFHDNGLMFDVATLGELFFLHKATGSVRNSVYTSVTQTYEEFQRAVELGVRLFAIGSLNGLNNLRRAVGRLGARADVLVRISTNATKSLKDGKFGVPTRNNRGEDALKLVRALTEAGSLSLAGFHFHVGTQVLGAERFANAVEKITDLVDIARREGLDLRVNIVDMGGGLPVSYDNERVDLSEISEVVIDRLERLGALLGGYPRLLIESGRFLVAEAGMLVSRIVNVKNYDGSWYVYLDTGYHNLLDAAFVKQVYPARLVPGPSRSSGVERDEVVLVGMLCDMDDVFIISRDSDVSEPEVGRYVVFGSVGAYSVVFNMPFHSQVKPPILLLRSDGRVEVARRRQSLEALYAEEGGDLL